MKRVFSTLLNFHGSEAHAHPEVRSLPRVFRIFHVAARPHVIGISVGTALMLTGSTMAVNAHDILKSMPFIPHVVWDATAYFLHGFGSLPVMAHVEPLWKIFKAPEH